MSLFNIHTVEQHAQSHADYMPDGKLWRAKNIFDSKIRDLLRGFGASSKRQEEALDAFWVEVFAGTTTQFITDFERALGIPDDIFTASGSLEDRRRDCVIKLAALYVVTEEDFINLAALFGFVITITRPIEDAFPPYDVPFTPVDLKTSRFTWIVNGDNIVSDVPPYDVPFDLGASSPDSDLLQRLFRKLKPANTSLQFANN